MSRLFTAIGQLEFARRYTLERLEGIDHAEWFCMPGGVTHVAWQVGHVAMADYRLLLERIRGRRKEDEQLISAEFLARFGKASTPQADASEYPPPNEIFKVFSQVRVASMEELHNLADEELDNPVLKPHRLFQTKLGSLQWAAIMSWFMPDKSVCSSGYWESNSIGSHFLRDYNNISNPGDRFRGTPCNVAAGGSPDVRQPNKRSRYVKHGTRLERTIRIGLHALG